MKLNLAIPGLLIALLVGCKDTTTTVAPTASPSVAANSTTTPVVAEKTPTPKPTTTPVVFEKIPTPKPTTTPVVFEKTPTSTATPVVSKKTPTSTATNPPNTFDSVSFPQASCGDKMPTDGTTDKVKLYPVFVDYSDSNLQAIKANYCRDALQTIRKDSGEKAIQIGSFTSEERANQFKKFLENNLGGANADVGLPTVRIIKTTRSVKYSPKSLGLSEAQFKDISQLQGLPYSIKNESGAVDISKQFRIALPASIPDGFRVDKVEVFKG